MENRVSNWVELKATELATITFTVFDSIKLCFLLTFRTFLYWPIPSFEDLIEAYVITRVPFIKVIDGELHETIVTQTLTAVKGQLPKFNNDNTGFRGCNREAYSGPLAWYNQGGGQTYYTDVYGNVSATGVLKQTVSTVNTKQAGTVDQYGGLIMGYKSGNTADPQEQFKYHKPNCAPGLGLKN